MPNRVGLCFEIDRHRAAGSGATCQIYWIGLIAVVTGGEPLRGQQKDGRRIPKGDSFESAPFRLSLLPVFPETSG